MFKKFILIGIICISFFSFIGCEETENKSINKEKNQLELIQASTQLALERNGYKNDTSPQIDKWNISSNIYNDTKRWNAVTHSDSLGRIKAVFEWSGEDNDDMILKYLFCDRKVVIDRLKE